MQRLTKQWTQVRLEPFEQLRAQKKKWGKGSIGARGRVPVETLAEHTCPCMILYEILLTSTSRQIGTDLPRSTASYFLAGIQLHQSNQPQKKSKRLWWATRMGPWWSRSGRSIWIAETESRSQRPTASRKPTKTHTAPKTIVRNAPKLTPLNREPHSRRKVAVHRENLSPKARI